jgi:hypothetical protein
MIINFDLKNRTIMFKRGILYFKISDTLKYVELFEF